MLIQIYNIYSGFFFYFIYLSLQIPEEPKKTTVFDFSKIGKTNDIEVILYLNDDTEKRICQFVWKKYGIYADSSLVSILHADGTPWKNTYKQGKNCVISDEETKAYYKSVVEKTLDDVRNRQNFG